MRRDARRRQGDPARHLPDRAVRRGDLYQRVVLYSAVFPSIQRFHQPDAALPEIALYVGGKLFQSIFLCVTFINTLASGLASHASVSRLLYVMGRDNVFPEKFFGYIHLNGARRRSTC